MNALQYLKLVDTQAKMSLKADSAQYYFGYIWWILEPLLFVAVFYLVFDVFMNSGRADFLLFLMCGKLPFVWFSKSVTQASGSIVASAGLIGQVNIPKSLFPMSIIQEGLYKQSTVFLLLICVVLAYGVYPSMAWIALFPIMITQYLMIVACGLIGAILVCYMKDFSMLISLGMIFLMFISGVFFDVRDLPNPEIVELILIDNPLAFVLDAYRQVLMDGGLPDIRQLAIIAACFLALVFAAILFLRNKSQAIALRAITA